jgi:4-carboxymuconolactone decarboxylase
VNAGPIAELNHISDESMTQHGRVPWYEPSSLGDDQRIADKHIMSSLRSSSSSLLPLVDCRGRLEGPFNAMLADPMLDNAPQDLRSMIRYRTGLTSRQREIATLAVAAAERGEFEWYAHRLTGGEAGLESSELVGLRTNMPVTTFDAGENMVRELVQSLLMDRDLPDRLFEEAKRSLGLIGVVELITLTSYYQLLALSLRVLRTPLLQGVEVVFGAGLEQ